MAEGGKPRLGGQLPVGAVAPTADASIRVLPPIPPSQYPATTEPQVSPNSYSFLWVKVYVLRRRNRSRFNYGGSVKMRSGRVLCNCRAGSILVTLAYGG